MSQLFGVSEEKFLRWTDVVMDALIANLQQIIRWPKPSEFEEFASEFEKVGRFFPNVIGAIDGLHLEIELTEERRFEPSFINYKQFHSLHLQVSSVPYQKKSIFSIGKFSQHIHRVLIQVFFWISN